jgi:serine/threonine protein kinase
MSRDDIPAGARIAGRYEVVRTLGRGAFGRTFLARDLEQGRPVAVKMLDARRATDLKTLELFEREAAVLKALRHHGIPEVFAAHRAEWDGAEASLLVMEYIEGMSLEQLIAAGRHLGPAEVQHLLIELLGILDYLHGRLPPVLHRDVKPANIIVRPGGSPALVDFGAVRRVFLRSDESGSTVVGTYGYMPYEQHIGQATPASDLFALGATLLHVLTGRPPADFASEEGRIVVPEDLPGGVRLRAVLAGLLRPLPSERFQSAREVREALLIAPEETGPGRALAPRRGPDAIAPADLPPVPRALEGPTRDLYRKLAWPWYRIGDGSAKPTEGTVLSYAWDACVWAFFSVLTAGSLPIIFMSYSSQRKRRIKPFLRQGLPVTAEIVGIQLVDIAFGEKMARVSYEFEADGAMRRDADQVLPVIAGRWREGDRIQVLYLPERDYDSLIISTG